MPRPAQLYLATVTMRLGTAAAPGAGRRAGAVSDALMAHPDVVTVRPEYGEEVWLYRADVTAEDPDTARRQAVGPLARLREDVGVEVAVVDVAVMDEAERRRFHRPFYDRLTARTGERLAIDAAE